MFMLMAIIYQTTKKTFVNRLAARINLRIRLIKSLFAIFPCIEDKNLMIVCFNVPPVTWIRSDCIRRKTPRSFVKRAPIKNINCVMIGQRFAVKLRNVSFRKSDRIIADISCTPREKKNKLWYQRCWLELWSVRYVIQFGVLLAKIVLVAGPIARSGLLSCCGVFSSILSTSKTVVV